MNWPLMCTTMRRYRKFFAGDCVTARPSASMCTLIKRNLVGPFHGRRNLVSEIWQGWGLKFLCALVLVPREPSTLKVLWWIGVHYILGLRILRGRVGTTRRSASELLVPRCRRFSSDSPGNGRTALPGMGNECCSGAVKLLDQRVSIFNPLDSNSVYLRTSLGAHCLHMHSNAAPHQTLCLILGWPAQVTGLLQTPAKKEQLPQSVSPALWRPLKRKIYPTPCTLWKPSPSLGFLGTNKALAQSNQVSARAPRAAQ